MKQKKVFAVFGYNNTRSYDLIKLRKIFQTRFNAELLLIKEGIIAQDRELAAHCLDSQVETSEVLTPVIEYLKNENLELLGCLPFSDKGVIGAAFVARHFGLAGDDCNSSYAMLDKSLFRRLESEIDIDSICYRKPFFLKTNSEAELFEILSSKGCFFIKPTSEGNSRGCMKIQNKTDLLKWLSDYSACLSAGVICEEILADDGEYSFDGVSGSYWITKKFTTSGAYRAEYQHVVPAPLSALENESFHKVLEPLLTSLGSRGGAFHHEFFILNDNRLASVEPNRRPGGMWLWDLASWAFEEFNPWTRWVDHCAGISSNDTALKQKSYAGIRGVISNYNGTLSRVDQELIENELKLQFGESNVKLSFLKSTGAQIKSEPRDNSDFLAFIALKNENYEALIKNLDAANRIFLSHTEVNVCA